MRMLFFEETNKIDKLLVKLTKRQRMNIQINKIKDEMGNIITDTKEIQRTMGAYFKNYIPPN